jgi:hypothetical protein
MNLPSPPLLLLLRCSYYLTGAAEVFTNVGIMELFYSQ